MANQNAIDQNTETLVVGTVGGAIGSNDIITAAKSNAGSAVQVSVINTDNTNAASESSFVARAGADNGDPFVTYILGGGGGVQYAHGIDNSDSDIFKLNYNAAGNTTPSVGTTAMALTSTGEITFPTQPAFLATHTVLQSNVTGNGTTVTVNFTTEIFDQNSNYDGTNVFVAPVSGRYWFYASVNISSLTSSSTDTFFNISTSNREYFPYFCSPGNIISSTNTLTISGGCFADMDATDSCVVKIGSGGLGGDTADLPVSATNTYFGGFLQC